MIVHERAKLRLQDKAHAWGGDDVRGDRGRGLGEPKAKGGLPILVLMLVLVIVLGHQPEVAPASLPAWL